MDPARLRPVRRAGAVGKLTGDFLYSGRSLVPGRGQARAIAADPRRRPAAPELARMLRKQSIERSRP